LLTWYIQESNGTLSSDPEAKCKFSLHFSEIFVLG
jgi:hypothetical protein